MQSRIPPQNSSRIYTTKRYRTPIKGENLHPNLSKIRTPNSKKVYKSQRNPLKTPFKAQNPIIVQTSTQKNFQYSTTTNTTKYSQHQISGSKHLKNGSILNFTPRAKYPTQERFSSIKTSKLVYAEHSGKKPTQTYGHSEYQNHCYIQKNNYNYPQRTYQSGRKTKISPLSRTPFQEKNSENLLMYSKERSQQVYPKIHSSGKKTVNYFNSRLTNLENNYQPVPCKNYLIHTPPPNYGSSNCTSLTESSRFPGTTEEKKIIQNKAAVMEYGGYTGTGGKSYHIDGESLNKKAMPKFDSLEEDSSKEDSCEKNFIEGLAKIGDDTGDEGVGEGQQVWDFDEISKSGEEKGDFIRYKNDLNCTETEEGSPVSNKDINGYCDEVKESKLMKSEEKEEMQFQSFENFDPRNNYIRSRKLYSGEEDQFIENEEFKESFGPLIKITKKQENQDSSNPFKNSNKKNPSKNQKIIEGSGTSVAFNEPEYQKVKEDYIDGSTYIGFKLKEKKHGKGTLILSNGSRYEGDWRNDVMSGIGKLFYDSNVLAYEGGFLDNKVDGHGVMHNDQFFDGEEEKNKGGKIYDFRDFTTVKENWVSFDGSFKGDLKDGVGKWQLCDGSIFVGEFEDDLAHGDGVFYESGGGDIVAGKWEKNVLIEVYN